MYIDENPTVTGRHGIEYVPTTILFSYGVEIDRLIGALFGQALLDYYTPLLGNPLVAPAVTLRLSGLRSGAMRFGRSVTAGGSVKPASLAGDEVTLTVQKKHGAGYGADWVVLTSATRAIGPGAVFSWRYKPTKRGTYRMQAAMATSDAHQAAKTAWCRFRVK